MSIRAEVLRLALRAFKRGGSDPDIAKIRRNMDFFKHLTPNPPKATKVTALSADGMAAMRIETPQSREDCHVLYLHGGAYVYGSPSLYRDFTWRIADATAARVLCIDYRLAPEHPFPAAVDDAVAAYRWLLADGADPRRIAIIGDSAGGGLTFGTLLRLRDEGLPMPAAAAGLSPWTDLALTGDTLKSNAKAEPMLHAAQAEAFANLYLGGADPKHPHASPLYGDHRGLPPSLLQVGSDEILRADAERMATRLRQAGCVAELEVWPRMPHVWHLFARILPEGRQAVARVGDFVRGAFAAG
jgi:monoterpene epsilon-lactone hydrolase